MRTVSTLLLILLYVASCQQTNRNDYPQLIEPVASLYNESLKPFYHGVASGDPLPDGVVIWTRVTPADALPEVEVNWEVSASKDFSTIVKSGTFTTSPSRDYTVKVVLSGLESGQVYYYRFNALGGQSIIGRTKTASIDERSLRFAVVSCSNYEWGYFGAYGDVGKQEILDAVIHLGDYIYEYGPGEYGDTTIGRIHIPAKEITTLQDYRYRYSQYRLDTDLRSAHANHPFITIWDDHEIANDSYVSGAENHQEEEGSFDVRKKAAVQTYYEWMPIRESKQLYRAFAFGSLADLIMLDERIEGRTKPVSSIEDPGYDSEERSMLGEKQLSWLEDQLAASNASWKIIGNQVIFTDLDRSKVHPGSPKNLDSWDGYPSEKRAIASFIHDNPIANVLFITGDTHASWVFETVIAEVSDDPIAIEFGTTSINSANYDEYSSLDTAKMNAAYYLESNPHLKFNNLWDHGYLLLNLTEENAKGTFYYVNTLRTPDSNVVEGPSFNVPSGTNRIESVD